MPHRLSVPAFAAALALALAAPAAAQDEQPNSLVRGKHALAFDIPQSGGGALSGWVNLRDRTQLGVQLVLDLSHDVFSIGDTADVRHNGHVAEIGAEMRRFVTNAATVAPFVSGSVFGGLGRSSRDDPQAHATSSFWEAGANAGFGVEWFPVRSVSVGGTMRVGATYSHSHNETDIGGGQRDTNSSLSFGTGTSSLSLKVYF